MGSSCGGNHDKMQAVALIVMGGVALVLGTVLALELREAAHGGRAPQAPPTRERWERLGEWSGREKGSTQKFTVMTRRWQVSWTAQPMPNTAGGRLNVYVFRDGEHFATEVPLRRWIESGFPTTEITPIATGPGTFWLRCDCPQVDWSLAVDQIAE